MTLPSLSNPRRVKLLLHQYYKEYCLPRAVSTHRLWLENYEVEGIAVVPIPNVGITQYYRVTFTDGSTVSLPRDHSVTVEILPGLTTNR